MSWGRLNHYLIYRNLTVTLKIKSHIYITQIDLFYFSLFLFLKKLSKKYINFFIL